MYSIIRRYYVMMHGVKVTFSFPVEVDLDDVNGGQVHQPEPQAGHQADAAGI